MEAKNDTDQSDEIMLPGFRFHPTDEELVGFYLKRKVQQKALSIELIKQLDIYKYDPWDLPKMASIGEKEWYFYCPRDRKYRNSARPNRVTTTGFWKATGTDRPIYSSDGTKCIGLKKSLVFYKGRAAKGSKTDWMMHEFRLPTLADSKKTPDKNIPTNDVWAICRIFKKNTIAQRVMSHAWDPAERKIESGSFINSDNGVEGSLALLNEREDLSTETKNQTSTSSNLSSADQGCYNHDFNTDIPFQAATYTPSLQDSYDKLADSAARSLPPFCGLRSTSSQNLETPQSNGYYSSHIPDPMSLKGTFDSVNCVVQMSPMTDFGARPPTLDITPSYLNVPKTVCHQSFPWLQSDGSALHSEVFYKKSTESLCHRLSPRSPSNVSSLPFPNHFYDVWKSNVAWESESSTVDLSATHTSH